MGFKPAPNTQYFLIAKNSNMPLGVRNNSGAAGAELEQQEWNPNSPQPQQHFQFDVAPNYYFYIKPGHRDLYLEPQGSQAGQGRTDGTPIVQAVWNGGAGQQRFLLVPAGDGYYRIRSMHSIKFLDVYGNTTAVGARLVQHERMSTDNQLFRPVPVAPPAAKPLPANTTSFVGYSNYGRMLVMGLAGVVPKVGGGIAAVIGLMWPKDDDQRFWQQMKDYVDVRMTQMLQHQHLATLEGYLMGLIGNLRLANAPKASAGDKWSHLVAITTSAKMVEDQFLNQQYQDSYRVLSHLSAWGTLVLGANAQMARNYAQLHPGLTPQQEADGIETYLDELRANIVKYTAAVADARANALAWRLAKIYAHGGTKETARVYDSVAGWVKYVSTFYASSPQILKARRSQIAAQFEADMDALLAPTRLWRFLDPGVTERPARETIQRTVGPFPIMRDKTPFEEVTGTITSVSMGMQEDQLFGLVVYYADGRKRISGQEHAGMKTLTLAENEYIISAYGTERNTYISGLTLETNLGQVFSTAPAVETDGAIDFMASLDDTLSPRLTGFSKGGGGLCFHWEYSWDYDWTGQLAAAEPPLAEAAQLAPPRPVLRQAAPAGPDPVMDFTTREFAAGEW